MSSVLKLRKWLMLDEAAKLLTSEAGEHVGLKDVLRFVLDEQLTPYLHLAVPVKGRFVVVKEGDNDFVYRDVQGLWRLPVQGSARTCLEGLHLRAMGWPQPEIPRHSDCVVISQDGEECEVPPQRSGATSYARVTSLLPESCHVVAMTSDLLELAKGMSVSPQRSAKPQELKPRERDTLLTIIAALAHRLPEFEQPFKLAGILQSETEELGRPVSSGAIAEHLKRAAQLVRSPSDKKPPRQ